MRHTTKACRSLSLCILRHKRLKSTSMTWLISQRTTRLSSRRQTKMLEATLAQTDTTLTSALKHIRWANHQL